LLRFSIGILAALTVLSFAEFLSGANPQAALYAGIEGAALLVTAGLWRLNRQGRTWLSSNLLIVILLVFLTFGIEPAWLLSGPTLAAYVIPIAIAGLLFGPLAGFIICIAVTGLVILRAFTGIVTDPALTFDPLQIALSLLALYFLATINWRSFRNLLQALDVAQRSAAAARALSEQLEEYASRLEESQRQLSRRAEYLEAAAQVAGVAAATLEQHQLLTQTADLISQRFDFYHTGVFLLDDRGECVVLHAASSVGGERMLARGHSLLVTQEGIVSSVAASGMPQILSDVQVDPTYTSNPDLPDTRSALALPLKAHGKIIGVLDVQSTQRDAFSNEDVTVLQTLTDQVAVAISNARLFQQAQENLKALRRVFGQISHEAWAELLRVQPDLGYRRDRRGTSPVSASEKPATGTADTIPYPSTEKKNGATLVRPIRVREMVVGTINARKAQGAAEWTSAELNLLEALVGKLAVALEDARLYQETQRRAHHERITRQITEKVRANPNVQAISQTAAKELVQALKATRGFAQLNLRVLDTKDTLF
jgi:GAF domain-containing protein